MRILLPLLMVGLAACYSPRSTVTDAQATGPYGGWDEAPLQASLWIDPHTNLASFDVNKPAHVAVFHWQPGRSFTMVYPALGQAHARSFDAGRHHLWTRTQQWTRQSLVHHASNMRGSSILRHASSSPGMSGLGEPSYFVMIASERPLDVSPFYGMGQSMWANRVAWSYNPYTATELLASQIVPQAASSDWTAAYQVVWPIMDDRPRPEDVRWVHCPGGIIAAVPYHVLAAGLFACPDGVRPEPADADSVDVKLPSEVIDGIRARRAALDADRPSAEEMQSLVERIREARRSAGEDVDASPLPTLRRVDEARRTRTTATAMPSAFRPVIRPAVPERGHAARGLQAPGMRTDPRSRQGLDRPRPHADSPRPAANRPRPDVRRPRPQADRPASPPRVEPRPPARPVGDRPPPDGSLD